MASLVAMVVGAVGQQLPEPHFAALFGVVAGAAVAALMGGFVVILFAGTYVDDRGNIERSHGTLAAYGRRAATWGVASAGIGALLATALPQRMAAAPPEPGAIPLAGWLAMLFGGAGVGIGILEEWRERTLDAEAEARGQPQASARGAEEPTDERIRE